MRHLESWWIMIRSPSHMRTPCESSSRPFLSCLRRDLSPKPRFERWSSDVQLEHVGTIVHLVSILMHCSDLTVPGLLLDIRNHHSHQCMAYTQGQNSKLHVTTTETTWNCLNTSRDPTFTCHVCNFSWSVILILILVQGPDHLTSLSCYVAMTRVVGPMLYLL